MTEREANIIIVGNIRALLDKFDMTQAELADKIGVVPATVSAWFKGKSAPRMDKIDKIANVFNVSRSSLLKDVEPPDYMTVSSRITDSELNMIEKYRTLDSHGKHNIDYLLDAEYSRVQQIIAASKGEAVDNSTTIAVPLLQNALSGKVIGTVPVLAKGDIYKGEDDLLAVQVTKDTMAPRFSPGDTLIYKRQTDVNSGDIAIVIIDGTEAVCKKVIKEGDTIKLVPLNTKYETKVFHIDDIKKKRLEILGKVVENIQAI